MGSIAEMTEGMYMMLRTVIANKEVCVDEGDIDMFKIVKILKRNNFDGVLIPDHTPQMTYDAPWYEGKAYAMGYMKAAMSILDSEDLS